MSWITCLECEAHSSWCDHPDEHTWQEWKPPKGEEATKVHDLSSPGWSIVDLD